MTRAAVRAAIAMCCDELAARGKPVRGARIAVDGSILLLTDDDADALPFANENSDWVSRAGKKEIPCA